MYFTLPYITLTIRYPIVPYFAYTISDVTYTVPYINLPYLTLICLTLSDYYDISNDADQVGNGNDNEAGVRITMAIIIVDAGSDYYNDDRIMIVHNTACFINFL